MDVSNVTEVTVVVAPVSQLVDTATRQLVNLCLGFVTASSAVFGVLSNALNIVVFYRLGISKPANLCFFTLAICDLVSVSWAFSLVLSGNRYYREGNTVIPLRDVAFILSPIFHCCNALGSWTITIINMERSCCVVFPLKVKRIFNIRTVRILILLMLVYILGTNTPYYFCFDLVPFTNPANNWTKMVVDYRNHDAALATLTKFISFSIPTSICFTLVVVGTVFLIKRFNSSRELRQSMTSAKSEEATRRDKRLIKSAIFICVIYIVGFALNVLLFLASMAVPELNMADPYLGNVFDILAALSINMQTISSSINIVVYVSLNSHFRQALKKLFGLGPKDAFAKNEKSAAVSS